VRRRVSIVDPTAGVTRDRISAIVEHEDTLFEAWDTGGIGTLDNLAAEVESQIEIALARADLVLFLVDAQEGLMPLDREIGRRLRKIGREVLLVANKVDHPTHEDRAIEFNELGFGPPQSLCARHGYGRHDLLNELTRRLPQAHAQRSEPVLRLAIVGRQNVGKSTLINTLAQEDRVIVSELAGTTRDAVDVRFEHRGRTFVAVDTAGLKRKSRLADSVEFYSLTRAHRSIRRCDVVIHMLDVGAEISRVDKQLAAAVERETKPCIFAVNKWDVAEEKITTESYIEYLNAHLTGFSFAPVSFMSATNGTNIDATLGLAETLFEQSRYHVSTAKLNEVVRSCYDAHSPRAKHGKRPKFFYATQIGSAPLTFLIFASHPNLIDAQYTRYLANALRSALPFAEVPLRIFYRARKSGERKADDKPGEPQD